MEVKYMHRTKPVPRGMMCLQLPVSAVKLVYSRFGSFMTDVVLTVPVFVD